MRFWPFRRRPAAVLASPAHDDVLLLADPLGRAVEEVLEIRDRQLHGAVLVYRGRLRVSASRAVDALLDRFRPFGYTPFVRADGDGVAVQAWPLAQTLDRPRTLLNVTLFVLTCLSMLLAGAIFYVGSPTFDAFRARSLPLWFVSGVPFASTLLAILVVHEFGHYFTARYHRAGVSLPYFIPAPPPFPFGTLGAIIRMRSPGRDKNALFDIAAAGPLAGLAVAVPAIMVGLSWSALVPSMPAGMHGFGESLLWKFLVYLQFGSVPGDLTLFTHPVADAGWAGFLVTAINLFPVGQLDGGRIAYALFGPRHRAVGIATVVAMVVMGLVTASLNWFVWAGLVVFLIGFHHSPPLDDVTPLSRGRFVLGLVCLVLMVLLIPPVPL